MPPAGTPNSCSVNIVEDVTSSPGRLMPHGARQLFINPRNTEPLRRLALIAKGHTKPAA